MPTYIAHFRTDAQWASYDFEADTPELALQMARDLWKDDPDRLLFEDYEMMPVNEITISDPDGSELAFWFDTDMRLRLAAPRLLKALEDLMWWWAHSPYDDEKADALFGAALAACSDARDEAPLPDSASSCKRPPSLRDLLKLALHALNEAPSFPVRHARYRNSYEVCAAIEAALREREGILPGLPGEGA